MKRLIAALQIVVADQQSAIEGLQPDTVLTVYHGTTAEDAHEMALNGIDARKPHHRKYPHHSSGKKITRGLYVSPELKVARGFGSVILEFEVEGRYLWPMFPTLMKKDDEALKEDYPKSFRPSVSHDMLERHWENQALFVGAIASSGIKKIYVYERESNTDFQTLSRSEFLALQKKDRRKHVVQPHEANISPEEFFARIAEKENYSMETIDDVMNNVIDGSWDRFYDTFSLFAPYSVLKKVFRKI